MGSKKSNSKILAKVNFTRVEIADPSQVQFEARTVYQKPAQKKVFRKKDSATEYVERVIGDAIKTTLPAPKRYVVTYMKTGPTTEVLVFDHREATLSALDAHILTATIGTGGKETSVESRLNLINALQETAKVVITQKGEGDNTRVNINLYDPEFPNEKAVTPTVYLSHSRKRPTNAIWQKRGFSRTVTLAKR